MSEVATYGDARERIDRIKAHVTAAWADIVEAYRQRDWVTLGYPDWDAMCEGEFGGARIALPIADRRQVVADLRGEGMSTRAIASAVGVDAATVHRDIRSGVADATPAPVIGQDGKSYAATRPAAVTTRVTEITEVVDLDTGEILGEEVTAEVWEAEHPLDAMLAADPDVRAANVRKRGTALLAYLHHPHPAAAELAAIDAALTEQIATRLALLAAQYRTALPRRLAAVKES